MERVLLTTLMRDENFVKFLISYIGFWRYENPEFEGSVNRIIKLLLDGNIKEAIDEILMSKSMKSLVSEALSYYEA